MPSLKAIFLPWLRVAELHYENIWLLDGWNRACAIHDQTKDTLERALDQSGDHLRALLAEQTRNRELAEELGALRERLGGAPAQVVS